MLRYVAQRLLSLIPVLLGITLLVFLFLHLLPGDPALALLGERATPSQVAALREQMGLNDPLPLQYLAFLKQLLSFDLGRSITSGIPIAAEIQSRWPATCELAIASMLLATMMGIPAGVYAATHKNGWLDHLIMSASLIGVSMPVYWLGLLLKYLFAINLGWFPPSGRLGIGAAFGFEPVTGFYLLDGLLQLNLPVLQGVIAHLVLPALTLSTIPLAIVARMTRVSLLEVLSQDYIRTARAKGVPEQDVILTHALKGALLPIVTTLGLQLGTLLGGAILTETIFAWPGIGSWIYEGILDRDYPVVQGGVVLIAITYTVLNVLVDLSYGLIDPRIQYK